MIIKFIAYFFAFLTSTIYSATAAAQTLCSCENAFNSVVAKVAENYIGYTLTKDKIEANYKLHIDKYRALTIAASEENCTALLQSFLQFFKDGHLFVAEYPNPTVDEKLKVKKK